ncbi:MAG: methylenetetrahydrofolate--tRNA-(uracil(54)-C(5))-methyltransferase (FADH(2)-oxidizing) TrmFO [Oscillospiraceae bacterium]|jgi:methylenetetrahydrofolate--tRNA-(uracil-5-)-methyltransferase|nr:methylenetetrahydrofolate--tRNA-(uracil(54)-C(5))-methyltransferase (FADH(2)-oxidizing) TrmFO [Oscillospiraceae bacterium]
MSKAVVVGAGFAGVEAAMQLAGQGIEVDLFEQKPQRYSPAHRSENFAELVCSNSFKAIRIESAAGLLKEEMSRFSSISVECAKKCSVPAGGALSVDRDQFSKMVTEAVSGNEFITVHRQEVKEIPEESVVIMAAGPLVSAALAGQIERLCGKALYFFDAAAPIVEAQSIDMNNAFFQSRYDRGEGDDYINCPLNKDEYESFYSELLNAKRAELHEFDKRNGIYEGCMPIEVMASRGIDTMRFGPLKPVGLCDPKTGGRPYAVLQLRKETQAGTMYNLVGFQTNLKFSEQQRVFSMIPALKNARFVRYGVMHRNTFLDSPRILGRDFGFKKRKGLYFAGQITGVEGYMESAASGILAGINAARFIKGYKPLCLPKTTMMGALSSYISDGSVENFQPMGANFGLLAPLEDRVKDKRERYIQLARRALLDLGECLNEDNC